MVTVNIERGEAVRVYSALEKLFPSDVPWDRDLLDEGEIEALLSLKKNLAHKRDDGDHYAVPAILSIRARGPQEAHRLAGEFDGALLEHGEEWEAHIVLGATQEVDADVPKEEAN